MNEDDKEERGKITAEETVNLKLPLQVLDFAEFYAEIGGMERDVLLTKLLNERLCEIKSQFKSLPYMKIPELW